MNLTQSWRFFKGYVHEPRVVGALMPSSRPLALALCDRYRRHQGAAHVLEVGAGTGAITRHLGSLLKSDDRLDVCEIRRDFGDIIERDVLSRPEFRSALREGRVRLLCQPVQAIVAEHQYDYVISGLPFTAFQLEDVQTIFEVIRRCLKPDGVFSYFEYIGLRRASRMLMLGRERERIRSVSAFLTRCLRDHQFARRTVLQNIPPAIARHLRFNES